MEYTPETKRDLHYYQTIDKVYWVPINDITNQDGQILIKRDSKVPCIFVEKTPDQDKILKFDYEIEHDEYRYTAWRKVIGITYNIHVGIYLIHDDCLLTLAGDVVNFNSLGRSDVLIDKQYLGMIDIK